ncbi:MAG: sugar ABC transporter permease, partial [Proteobacteria bacterium]|nr:sugar ABC transporter permease [Pseudomonadota bacterium]
MSLDRRRNLAMAAALVAIWAILHGLSDGVFLTPRNLYNLAVQSSVVAVMATGMVLVIVARHIDLSVGSVLGFVGMAIATLQVEILPVDAAWNWPLSIAVGLALGAAIGAWQGYWVAYRGLPAFVVTLAGLLMFRGGAFLLTDGRTVAPLDPSYQLLGGGLRGSIGAAWSWALGGVVAAGLVARGFAVRARRVRLGVTPRPLSAEIALLALGCGLVALFVGVMNST